MLSDYVYKEVTKEEFINNVKKMPCLNCLIGMLCVKIGKYVDIPNSCKFHLEWAINIMHPMWQRIPYNDHPYHQNVFKRLVLNRFSIEERYNEN